MRRYGGILLASLSLMVVALLLSVNIGTTAAQTPDYGANWTGTFYNSTTPAGAAAATVSYPVGLNENWGTGAPTTGVQIDNFSAIFTSTQPFQQATYTFSITVDDSATVTINGQTIFPAPGQTIVPGQTYTFTVTFPAAANYPISITYTEFSSLALLQFFWTTGAVNPGVPGVPTATPGPTGPIGSVVNVRGLSLRTGPYLGASFIGVLRPDIAYNVLAQNNDEGGGFTWYKVDTGERVGWSSGRYLVVTNGEPPPESTVFETLAASPDTGAIAVPRAIMNFRVRPSIRSARIAQIPWGAEIPLLGRTIQGGRDFWYLVRFQDQVGWIFAPYVGVRGNINAVPVY